MKDPKASTDHPKSDPVSPKGFLEAINEFNQIHLNYGRSQYEAGRGSEQSQRTAYRDFLNVAEGLHEDMQKRCEEVYKNYTSAMQDTAVQEDPAKRMATTQREVAATMEKIYEDTHQRLDGAYRDYVDRKQENQKQAYHTYREGYRDFLQAMKNAWAQVDVDAVINANH